MHEQSESFCLSGCNSRFLSRSRHRQGFLSCVIQPVFVVAVRHASPARVGYLQCVFQVLAPSTMHGMACERCGRDLLDRPCLKLKSV
jgi:hypothetical protein